MAYILLTGASGNLGAVILEQLLQQGHSVNAVIRSFAKNKAFLSQQYPKAVEFGKLTFTEIPDMTVSNAFHDAAKNASAIIHAATPLAYENFLEEVIKPVSLITKNVLDAAAASPSVQRVVVTGSIVSTLKIPDQLFNGATLSEKNWNPTTLEEGLENVNNAYGYSKTSSEHEAWAYIEEKKPAFELVYLLVPSITGKSIQPGAKLNKKHLGGISGFFKALYDVKKPGFFFPYYLDVEDTAAAHLKALSPSVPGNQRYLFHGPGVMLGDEVANFVRQKYSELRSRIPAGEENVEVPPGLIKTDTSRAEKVFGIKWKSWQESVPDMVKDIERWEREGLIEED